MGACLSQSFRSGIGASNSLGGGGMPQTPFKCCMVIIVGPPNFKYLLPPMGKGSHRNEERHIHASLYATVKF